MKSRSFSAAVFVIAAALSVSGCSTILIKPAAGNVKTVALVSAFMNRDFYNIKDPQTSMSLGSLVPLGRALVKGTALPDRIDDPLAKEHEAIIAYGIKAYTGRLEGAANWNWLPVTDILSNDTYRKFADAIAAGKPSSRLGKASATINEAEWCTAGNMVHIPLDSVVPNGTFDVSGKVKDLRPALAQLCRDLNVDAVAILEFDMAYRKPLLGIDIIRDLPAVPSISSTLVLVNKDGEVVIDSGLVTRGQGRRFEGRDVGMLCQNTVHLYDKSIASYCQAIDKAADDMEQRLVKALSRKK